MNGTRRRVSGLVLIVATACGVLITTACSGGSAGPDVAQLTSAASTAIPGSPAGSPSASGSASSLAHAECMRSHGVPDFPDPGPLNIDVREHPDLDPNSPHFVAAQRACLSLAPGGTQGNAVSPQLQADALAYSACMRSHGYPKFADPTFKNGGEQFAINGIDTDSAQFQDADKLCQTSSGLASRTSAGGGP